MAFFKRNVSPAIWVPTLYFAQGLPYALVIVVSTILYKNLGLTNSEITFYTGWFYLPWVIKPFFAPFIDYLKSKRFWIFAFQLLMGAAIATIGLTLPLENYIRWTLILFWLIAFSSANHDIAADGFYMLGLSEHQQSLFVGIRNTFWRIANIAAQGGLVFLSGVISKKTGSYTTAWSILFVATGVVYFIIGAFHRWALPHPQSDNERTIADVKSAFFIYISTLISFFKKKNIVIVLLFILFYRLGEAQLGKLAAPFLLDAQSKGGLGLDNSQVGTIYGTIGVLGLILGGILGGIVVAQKGLKYWIWPMALAMNLPDLFYVAMAYFQPENKLIIQAFVACEQFGYGFGFTAFTLYLLYIAQGESKTSHYAFATGLMALGMMVPSILSGYIEELTNYTTFFVWVTFCTLPGMLLIPFLKIDPEFGKRKQI